METTMTVTVKSPKQGKRGGNVLHFTISFKKVDFEKVVDQIESITLENIYTNPLWKVVE